MDTSFGKFGCCLACRECGNCRDPCYNCICSKCDWYHDGTLQRIKQRCFYLDLKKEISWFDFLSLVHSTEKAYLISDGKIQAWIPSVFVEFKKNEIGIISWIADEKGFFPNGVWELDDAHFKEFEEQHLPKTKYWCREEYYE